MEVFYFGVWCRPFRGYWEVPTPNIQCSAATHHLITNAVFNISSDLLTLALALQLFIRSKLPFKRKLVLCGIFGLGIFVILAAVLNKYYSFRHQFGSQWTFWYVRESSTAMIVANLPFLWTLLRRIFKLGAFDNPNVQRTYAPSSVPLESSRGEPRGWLQRLHTQGRWLSSQVLHGVNVSSTNSGSSRNLAKIKFKKKSTGSRLHSSGGDSRSEGGEQMIPQDLAFNQRDPEAQRQPWDEMDLGEFLTESNVAGSHDNTLQANGDGHSTQRRRSWVG